MKPVLVTNQHRGIYFGYLVDTLEGGNAVLLERARQCFDFKHVEGHCGVYGLASAGPGHGSRVGPRVTMKIRNVANVVDCTDEAVARWESASW